MNCQRCNSKRIVTVESHARDCHFYKEHHTGYEHNGYMPKCQVGNGDDSSFTFCLHCGQLQGQWPAPNIEVDRFEIGEIVALESTSFTEYTRDKHRRLEVKEVLEGYRYHLRDINDGTLFEDWKHEWIRSLR